MKTFKVGDWGTVWVGNNLLRCRVVELKGSSEDGEQLLCVIADLSAAPFEIKSSQLNDDKRGGKCNHRRCPEGDCQALTDEALTPSLEDEGMVVLLIADGWLGVSTKYRTVAKLKEPLPGIEIIDEKWRDHEYGQILARELPKWKYWMLRSFASGRRDDMVETKELTIKQWRAFKKLGGQNA